MRKGRFCRNCGDHLPTLARADAVYCSSACRTFAHRNPFPKQLTQLRQWVRFNEKKVPLTIDGRYARVNDPSTWSDYQSAKDSSAGIGVGFVFNNNGIIGIDLDHAIENGVVKDWARTFINSLNPTYTEISISGNGIHLLGLGSVEAGRRFDFPGGAIEVYSTARYFTMTGNRFEKTPRKLADLSGVLDVINPLVDSMNREVSEWRENVFAALRR